MCVSVCVFHNDEKIKLNFQDKYKCRFQAKTGTIYLKYGCTLFHFFLHVSNLTFHLKLFLLALFENQWLVKFLIIKEILSFPI